MTLDLARPRTAELLENLAPYARRVVERAADHALRLFADELVPEHLLTTIMTDDECAAHHAVIFAFADPQTIANEALALSPGILVVGSSHSLPFSPRAVRALFRARHLAAEAGAPAVGPTQLLASAVDELEEDVGTRLVEAGLDREALTGAARARPETASSPGVTEAGALFASFEEETRRILGVACKLAKRTERTSIAPAHLVDACVQRRPELARLANLTAPRIAAAIGRDDADATPPEPREVPIDEDLERFLAGLPHRKGGLTTLDLLRGFCTSGSDEILDILRRSRITTELLERVEPTYRDPDPSD